MPRKPRLTTADGIPLVPKNYVTKTDREAVAAAEAEIESAYIKYAAKNFLTFTRGLRIHSDKGPQVFERCMAEFQRECFEDIAPALHALRAGRKPTRRRFWWERTKKASKDADLAVVLAWLIAFPTRPFYAQVGAADREQAGIVKERLVRLMHYNPWLHDYIEIVAWEIRSKKKLSGSNEPMAKLMIMAADISGAHGGTPELLVLNELSHVTKWEFVQNLMSNAAGVPQGVVIVATNAGVKGTTAYEWRKHAIASDDWSPHILSRPAPWHSLAAVEDERRLHTPSRFKRLWQGDWVSGKGDALDEEDIDACFPLSYKPPRKPEPGWRYLFGLDLGISHDHSGAAVLGVNEPEQMVKIVEWRVWEPDQNTGEVDLMDVEDWCHRAASYWQATGYYDPHQAKLMAQRLVRRHVRMVEMSFSVPSNLTRMATTFIQVVQTRRILCYDDEDGRLRRDFGKFSIVEKPYGYKLEAVSDVHGHADVGTAVVICLPAAVAMLDGLPGLRPDDVLAEPDAEPLTEAEEKELPDEFRELFEYEDEVADSHRMARRHKDDPFAGLV